MTNVDKLKAEELAQLSNETQEIFDLESLIVDGAGARIPLEIDFPIYKDGKITHKKYAVIIKPIKSSELNNATQIGLKDDNSDVNTEIVKRGLRTKDDKPYPPEIVENLPAGVINQLTEHICEISGIQQSKEANVELIKEMMGF